ncbi:MAG: HEAT repeat domain-containing protein [Nitrospirota bacterium]
MEGRDQRGQANLTAVLLLLGLIVAGVWIWKRIPEDTKDYLAEQGVPLALLAAGLLFLAWSVARRIRRRVTFKRDRERLLARFERATVPEKRLELAFALIEFNEYRLEGLERVAPALAELFKTAARTAQGDKQHRVRGMAVSHLGVIQDKTAIPLLLKALEDDHAYVRGCAALALGRMRVGEARAKLEEVMQEDWDQTVRSRAREALERLA